MAERLVIDHVGHRGDGVCITGGESLFVPYTLGGETVEVERVHDHPDRRQLLRVEQPSPERIEPFCRYFGACGGCAIQHWQTEAYGAWKRAIVVDTLEQAGIACEVDAAGRCPWRRPAPYHGPCSPSERRRTQGRLCRGGQPRIVAIDDCPILDPGSARRARRGMGTGRGADVCRQAAGHPGHRRNNGLDVDVRGSGPLPSTHDRNTLARRASSIDLVRLTRHGELVLMRDAADHRDRRGARSPCRRARSCRRPSPARKHWRRWWRRHCKHARHIADLFCGVGPFALRLATKARVSAFDSDAGAIAALQKAATSTSGLKPVKAEARDLFRRPLMPQELRDYDAVVFDPPRQGAQAQVRNSPPARCRS